MKLSDKLYIARVTKKLSQQFVGNYVGVSAAMISFYEKGKSIPTAKYLKKLCELYELDYDEIIKNEKIPSEKKSLEGLSEEEIKERRRRQVQKASKKYYQKNKKKYHNYYERKKKQNERIGKN